MKTISLVAFLLLGGAASAQQTSYSFFGQSCGLLTGHQLAVQQLPRIGQSFTVALGGLGSRPNSGSWYDTLVTGFSNNSYQGVSLPYFHPLIGCPLRVSPEIALSRGFTFTIQIPNDGRLLGLQFYQQWITAWVPFCWWGCSSAPSWGTSNGGHGVIGL